MNNSILKILIVFTLLPSLRFFFKYFENPFFSLFLFTSYSLLVVYLFNKRIFLDLLLKRKGLITISIFCFLLISIIKIYPIADGLKENLRGSDQDNCVIVGVESILNGDNPLVNKSYYGNPCSPGIGLILIYTPLVLTIGYELSPILILVFLMIYLRKNENSILFLSFFGSNLLLYELLVVGSDFVFIGLSFLISLLLIEKHNKSFKFFIPIYCFLIILSTSRLPLIILPFSVVFYYYKISQLNFILFSSLIILLIVGIHLPFISNYNEFTFTHLIDKGNNLLSNFDKVFIIVSTFTFLLYGKLKNVGLLNYSLLIISPLLVITSFADLRNRGFKIDEWEGANYISLILPLILYQIVNCYFTNNTQVNE